MHWRQGTQRSRQWSNCICLSDDRCYLYDVISFFEEEANKRKENKIEDVWINNDRLDKFLLNITYVLDIDLDWYDLYREV